MTNLELAQRIAEAVRSPKTFDRSAAETVLDVLHTTGHAFSRLTEDDHGVTLWQCMDDDAERMGKTAMRSHLAHQQGLFTETDKEGGA